MIDRLENVELLQRVPHPQNLTSASTDGLDRTIGDVRSQLQTLLLELSPDEKARIVELLNAVLQIRPAERGSLAG